MAVSRSSPSFVSSATRLKSASSRSTLWIACVVLLALALAATQFSGSNIVPLGGASLRRALLNGEDDLKMFVMLQKELDEFRRFQIDHGHDLATLNFNATYGCPQVKALCCPVLLCPEAPKCPKPKKCPKVKDLQCPDCPRVKEVVCPHCPELHCPRCPEISKPTCPPCPEKRCPQVSERRSLGSDADATIEKLEDEISDLKEQLRLAEIAFKRVVEEKSSMEQIMADRGGGSMELGALSQERADKLLAKCGSAAGKVLTLPGVDVWKGYACNATQEEMERYLDYEPRGMCPDDWFFVQDLIYLKNCFALPKRRCKNHTPFVAFKPLPFPRSLFDQRTLGNEAVRWDQHLCKSFECLNSRLIGDCRNCFNLTQEFSRWKANYRGSLKMKEVIDMFNGTLRIGLDAGGGTGSFAAHMATHGVTVMTTAFNVETIAGMRKGLPYMETISLRGLIPLHIPHKSRLPFYDNILDIIHAVNSVKYLPLTEFEELLFEWDRVLRPGGVIWFEMFYTHVEDMPLYISMIELLEYQKLYWKLTPKPDAAEQRGPHVYLNCLVVKPARGRGQSGEE